jgi:hypothetical protein
MSCAEKFILKVGPRQILEILVQFGIWFNIKLSRAGSLTLNYFFGEGLILNHFGGGR